MEKEKFLILGGGGHAKVVIEAAKDSGFEPCGIIEHDSECVGDAVMGVPVIGTDEQLPLFYEQGIQYVFLGVGHVGNYQIRCNLARKAELYGYKFATIVHPSAIIAQGIYVSSGTLIGAATVINPSISFGQNCIINTAAILEHDCVLGNNVHISPNAAVAGGVQIGDNTLVGIGSNIIQGITIGKNCIIGAGSVVIRDVPDNTTVVGVPARPIAKKEG